MKVTNEAELIEVDKEKSKNNKKKEKEQKKKRVTKRKKRDDDADNDDDDNIVKVTGLENGNDDTLSEKCTMEVDKEKSKKEKKKEKMKKKRKLDATNNNTNNNTNTNTNTNSNTNTSTSTPCPNLPFDHRYILAPMVGASELPFRLLCRKYGTQLAYTPMISSTEFVSSPTYRETSFQTIPEDRPLVAHFSANDPTTFASAARLVEKRCDAIDLNLGCPQRTAYLGHFGSYLLGKEDRKLVCDMVRAAVDAVDIPIFCKIRLLDTVGDTVELCRELVNAGVTLIAIHARYRATFERKGAGARDGPALLDQVLDVRKALKHGKAVKIVANGNVMFYDDVVNNFKTTGADGIMSAEGILDNPSLFMERYGNLEDATDNRMIEIADPTPLLGEAPGGHGAHCTSTKAKRKLAKKLRQIEAIENMLAQDDKKVLQKKQKKKLATKDIVLEQITALDRDTTTTTTTTATVTKRRTRSVTLRSLHQSSKDELNLAVEYLDLTRRYPTAIRTVIFHTRRMLKSLLTTYQLMHDCIDCKSIDDVQTILDKIRRYRKDPSSFNYDTLKARAESDALARRKREEGRRKDYEARMVRKAKREGRDDREYYLRIGSKVPTVEGVGLLKEMESKQMKLKAWKEGNHSQHCMAFHVEDGGCDRERTCGFLHVTAVGETTFVETDEVAG